MNIFYLDRDPKLAAQYHCDKHVVKMLVEYAQIMSTAHRVLDDIPNDTGEFYRLSHKNHPSCIWVRESVENYKWLYRMWIHLHNEYVLRYKRNHASFTKLCAKLSFAPKNIPQVAATSMKLAIADTKYHNPDPVISYRNYYNGDKARFATWKSPSVIPEWFEPKYQEE